MPRPAAPTRERFTATAAQLLRRRGYAATGLNDVVAASGAPKGSLYHHFPHGKEQLAGEALARSGRTVSEHIEAALDAAGDLPAAVRGFATLLARNLERSGFRDGCPVATAALEAASESDVIGSACARAFDDWREAIAARLRDAGHAAAEADDRAVLVLCAFEGALIMARSLRDVQPLHGVAESLIRQGVLDP